MSTPSVLAEWRTPLLTPLGNAGGSRLKEVTGEDGPSSDSTPPDTGS